MDTFYKKLKKDAESSGYFLNDDEQFTKELIQGLLVNEKRYGYWACPCRLASGNKSEDLDIICPCDYRDDDLVEFGCCFCALYVSKDVIEKKQKISSIPDRREIKSNKKNQSQAAQPPSDASLSLSKPVWRCKVCGYLCGRDNPPEVCPICKAKKERFEQFL
ncbi:MAG: ferredoxin-thioredoxin reductase catalytic domain-containing protein [Thermoplasmatota archaeon]